MMKPIFFIVAGLLLSNCASYDVSKKQLDVGPAPGAGIRAAGDDVQEKKSEREMARKSSIRIQCSVSYPGDPTETSAPCTKIFFSLVDLDKKTEGSRQFPDHEGKLELAAAVGSRFGIRPGVDWKVDFIFEPAKSFYKAGDTIRILVRFQ